MAHFFSMTSFSAGLRAVSEATLACQAGSLAAFAIMVLRQSFVMDTSAPVESTNPSWHITHNPEPTKSSVVKSLSATEAAAAGTGVGVPCICASCVAMTSGVRIEASCVDIASGVSICASCVAWAAGSAIMASCVAWATSGVAAWTGAVGAVAGACGTARQPLKRIARHATANNGRNMARWTRIGCMGGSSAAWDG